MNVSFTVKIDQATQRQLDENINGIRDRINRAINNFYLRSGHLLEREAQLRCPVSPTQAQIVTKSGVRSSRKVGHPGQLLRDITSRIFNGKLEILVPSNALSADYAGVIHDAKGEVWFERGPGTVAKGPMADDKFIERAVKENEHNLQAILDDEVSKAIR